MVTRGQCPGGSITSARRGGGERGAEILAVTRPEVPGQASGHSQDLRERGGLSAKPESQHGRY